MSSHSETDNAGPARIDWGGKWPSLLPADFPRWLLHRLGIYASVAAIVLFLGLVLAAKMAGHSVGADAAVFVLVVGVLSVRMWAHRR